MEIKTVSPSSASAKPIVADRTAGEKSKIIEQQHEEQQMDVKKEKDEKKVLTKEEAEHVVNGMNEFLKPQFTSLQFKIHDETERYYVEVVDQDSKKVIREIPAKQLLDMYAKMTDFLGLFIDKKF
ncbi:flagellar protein FlaG [Cytobacillus firmus]|uniref:flagellar protein FlaG n=1 Tax=Cytobacillus firmus TaxID=1399 RepID=UPI0021894D81|nr:flagellar protein FlaG [Cytobacillus firmus]URM33478.1 flagellar protein FlaG [Cytobacillus firmus]